MYNTSLNDDDLNDESETIANEENGNEKNSKMLSLFENIGIYLGWGTLASITFAWLFSCMYHKYIIKSPYGFDRPNLMSVIKAIQNAGDFWTDVLVCIILYLQRYTLLYIASFIFTIVPFILSCICCVYWIVQWRKWKYDNPIRLTDYLNRYESLLCLLTVLAGFYAAVELCRSKLFFKRYFYFPLRKQEYNQLKHIKFVNVVLLEVRCL